MHTLVTILAKREHNESQSAFRTRVGREFADRFADGSVFDYADTDTAGRWSDDIHNNVIFEMADIMIELEKLQSEQKAKISKLLDAIEKSLKSTDLRVAVSLAQQHNENQEKFGWYFLNELSDRMYGFYTLSCPELIYLDDENSMVTDDIMQDVKEHPGEYGILFADCHF